MARAADDPSPLTPADLRRVVRERDASAVLVSGWLLRRVVAFDREPRGWTHRVAHCRLYALPRDRFVEIVGRQSLPAPDDLPDGSVVTLLCEPEAEWLAATPPADVLTHYWGLLFHARADAEFRRLFSGSGTEAVVREWIERVGRAAIHEARFVLQKDRHLRAAAGDAEALAEYAAVFLELYHFDRARLGWTFPAAGDSAEMAAKLADGLDVDEWLRDTRPPGAADLRHGAFALDRAEGEWPDDPAAPGPLRWEPAEAGPGGAARRKALLARADGAAARGNLVRAALLRMRAYRLSSEGGGAIHAAARDDLARLAARLAAALGGGEAAAADWRAAVGPLLQAAADGWWNPEGRLLYDLQKVCVDRERELYSVNVAEWLLDWRHWGRRALRRPLPHQRPVLVCKHLRSAAGRVGRVRLAPGQRAKLHRLLTGAVHRAERAVREQLRPPVAAALDAASLRPHHAVEEVAREKLVEELLDGVVRRGFLGMGNLRDTLSRNALKLHDLRGAREFVRGDQLLRLDRRLADALAGVYRRGEVYLRLIQKVSSLMFAWTAGRFVTRTVLIPVGGAYLILAGWDHTVGVLVHKLSGRHWEVAHPITVAVTALLLLGVVNWPAFRRAAWGLARHAARLLGQVFIGIPRWVLGLPEVRRVLASDAFRAAVRYVVKPAAVAAVVTLALPRVMTPRDRWAVLAGVFVAADVALNSGLGRRLERAAAESLRLFWAWLAAGVVADLYHWVVGFFQGVLERFERVLYQVDEWLRFRSSESAAALRAKAAAGFVWFFVAYAARFCINLLVEPQINPLKHFPVVTVSHKIILPTWPLLASALKKLGLGAGRANALAGGIVFSIPGIFGFFAWELKENWKLYRANRARVLGPVAVGSHGETLARLLRPGFHAGTVPKIFARLRRLPALDTGGAEEAARTARKAHHQLDALDHVREAVAHFVEREFAALLNRHPAWRDAPVEVGEVRLTATQVMVDLARPAAGGGVARVTFEQRAGWILAGIDPAGWTTALPPVQDRLLRLALLGLYHLSGVQLVREQTNAALAAVAGAWDLKDRQLVLWPHGRLGAAAYDLAPGPMPPRSDGGKSTPGLPTLDGRRLLLSQFPLPWDAWAAAWEADDAGPAAATVCRIALLPADAVSDLEGKAAGGAAQPDAAPATA